MPITLSLTDQDTEALDALNGGELLALRRFKQVCHRVILEQQQQIAALTAERDALKQQLIAPETPPGDVTPLVPLDPQATVAAISKIRDKKRNGSGVIPNVGPGGDG